MHWESTLGKTSRNISRLPKQVIVRNQIYDKAIGSPQWQLTETHSDLTTGTHQVSKSCRPAPQKGVASKNRKTSTDGLLTSLADKLYLYKTKQSTRTRARTHNVYKTCTGHPLVTYFNSTVDLRGWKVYWKQSMHTIHIYIYPGLWSCQMLQNMLAASSRGYDHSGVEHEVPTLPRLQPSSLSSLVSAGSRMWQVVRKTDAGMLTPQPCPLYLRSCY